MVGLVVCFPSVMALVMPNEEASTRQPFEHLAILANAKEDGVGSRVLAYLGEEIRRNKSSHALSDFFQNARQARACSAYRQTLFSKFDRNESSLHEGAIVALDAIVRALDGGIEHGRWAEERRKLQTAYEKCTKTLASPERERATKKRTISSQADACISTARRPNVWTSGCSSVPTSAAKVSKGNMDSEPIAAPPSCRSTT